MAKAYLRGLLPRKPIHGLRSHLRQAVVAEFIDMEESAAEMERRTLAAAAFLSRAAPEQLKQAMSSLGTEADFAALLRRYDTAGLSEMQRSLSLDRPTAVYEALAKAGLMPGDDEETDEESCPAFVIPRKTST